MLSSRVSVRTGDRSELARRATMPAQAGRNALSALTGQRLFHEPSAELVLDVDVDDLLEARFGPNTTVS